MSQPIPQADSSVTSQIFEKDHLDRFDNDVSVIVLADGRRFNMVHQFKGWKNARNYTIFGGRGKSVKRRDYSVDGNDCVAHSITIAGYHVEWGDGDNLGVTYEGSSPVIPELVEQLGKIQEDDTNAVVLAVIAAIADRDEAWTYKEVPARKAA